MITASQRHRRLATPEGMPVLDFSPSDFTTPLEQKLEEKFPLKTKGKYVLQMDNPYLLLNRSAFEAAGVNEENAENTAKSLVEEIFTDFISRRSDASTGRQKEPPALTNIYTSKQMREGLLPQTQYGRLIAHSYSPYVGWALHLNFGPYQFPWHGSGTTHFSANSYDRHVPLEFFGTAFVPGNLPWSSSARRYCGDICVAVANQSPQRCHRPCFDRGDSS